jgi:hypothetical protein
VTPCHQQFHIATSMLDRSLPTLIQILEGDHAVHTLKLEGHEAAYHRLGPLHRAAEEERPQGVGSGRPAAAKADANSRRGNSWRVRRAEDERQRCGEMRKIFTGSGGRRRRRRTSELRRRRTGELRRRLTGELRRRRWANPIAIPIARRGTREQVEGSG